MGVGVWVRQGLMADPLSTSLLIPLLVKLRIMILLGPGQTFAKVKTKVSLLVKNAQFRESFVRQRPSFPAAAPSFEIVLNLHTAPEAPSYPPRGIGPSLH